MILPMGHNLVVPVSGKNADSGKYADRKKCSPSRNAIVRLVIRLKSGIFDGFRHHPGYSVRPIPGANRDSGV